MRKHIFQKIVGLVAAAFVAIALCSCSKKPSFSIADFDKHEDTVTRTCSFSASDDLEILVVNPDKLAAFKDMVAGSVVDYGYDELFNYEQAISGIQVDHSVLNHKYNVLDANGKLTKEQLFETVRKNNAVYLAGMTSLIKDVEDTLLLRICEIVVDTINDTLKLYVKCETMNALSDYLVNNSLYMMLLSGDMVICGDEQREKQAHIMTHQIFKGAMEAEPSEREG